MKMVAVEDIHQDQGDASHVRSYVYAYGRLYIYGPSAPERSVKPINRIILAFKVTGSVTICGRGEPYE